VNTFTKKSKPRRGRPPGPTEQGRRMRARLYATAVALFVQRGYQATTLRQIARRARVSVGLLYRYFPSKRAVVLAMYEALSDAYATRAGAMPAGRWGERFLFALRTSLRVLARQRQALTSLLGVLVGEGGDNLFAASAAGARGRVQRVFVQAVAGAVDAPDADTAEALGRLLYVAHLAILLFWLLDRSPRQQATTGLLATLAAMLPAAGALLSVPGALPLAALDTLLRQALLEPA
jgi:AcrR family transcriptional regulator